MSPESRESRETGANRDRESRMQNKKEITKILARGEKETAKNPENILVRV